MYTWKTTYEDYLGNNRTEEFKFNLNEAEMTEMELGVDGGFTAFLTTIVASNNIPELQKLFKKLILKSYGEISPDGKRFIKSEELSTAFSQTEAYNQLYMQLAFKDQFASDFLVGIFPEKLRENLASMDTDELTETLKDMPVAEETVKKIVSKARK